MKQHMNFSGTAGISIPKIVNLSGREFGLREFVITHALNSEERKLRSEEEKEIIEVVRRLKKEYPECFRATSTAYCRGIIRAVHLLISLLQHHPLPEYRRDIEDLKRWLDFGKKL